MKASTILRIVSAGLQDLEPDVEKRWAWKVGNDSSVGLLDYMNSAIREIASQRPDCYSITESIYLEPGIRQMIPTKSTHGASADAVALCELTRNMGQDGKTPGRPILSVNQEVLFSWMNPYDENKTERYHANEVDNFCYDRATNPKVYYVYPAVPSSGRLYVEAIYYAQPPEVTSTSQDIGISDKYAQAIAHYMIAEVCSADHEASSMERVTYHMQLFQQMMAEKRQIDFSTPKAKNSIT